MIKTFKQVVAEAVAALSAAPIMTPELVARWATAIRNAAEREVGSDHTIDAETRARLGRVYERLMASQKIKRLAPGVRRFGPEVVAAQSRAELDRRTWAAADLIKIRKREVVARTEARLSGWITSVPPDGSSDETQREVRTAVGKDVERFSFERRRVDIDQSHKLIANVSNIVATGAGAIAGTWHDHGEHDKSYNYRKEHLARTGNIYVLRGSWADVQGLLVPVYGYYDEITAVGQEPFCRCYMTYITSPRRLPPEMLSDLGREWVARGAEALKNLMGVPA